MSSFDLVNFLMISDVDRGSKNQEHLADLRERAAYIGRTTGQEPLSWYEFKQSNPLEPPNTIGHMIMGSGIGLAIGIVGGLLFPPVLVPLALSGGLLGGAIGVFSDTENTRRNELVGQYEQYLDAHEKQASAARAMSQGITYKDTHAADLEAVRNVLAPQRML